MPDYKSNIDEVVNKLNKQISKKEMDVAKFMKRVAVNLHSTIIKRVHQDGKGANLSRIGQYSSKSMLTGRTGFKTDAMANSFFSAKKEWRTIKTSGGKLRRLAVVRGGYKQFRSLNGLLNDKVNLEFTGDLRNDFTFKQPAKNKVTLGFIKRREFKKALALELKYGKTIWGVGALEKNVIDKLSTEYIKFK